MALVLQRGSFQSSGWIKFKYLKKQRSCPRASSWEPRAGSRSRWRQRQPAPCQQGLSAPRTLWDAPEGRRPGPARPRALVPVPAVADPAPRCPAPERATAAVAAAAQARWGGQHALLPAPRGRGRGRHFAGGGFSAPGGHRREGSAAGAARDSQRAGKGSARLPLPAAPPGASGCCCPGPQPRHRGQGLGAAPGPAQPRLPRPRPAGPLVTVPTRQGFAALPAPVSPCQLRLQVLGLRPCLGSPGARFPPCRGQVPQRQAVAPGGAGLFDRGRGEASGVVQSLFGDSRCQELSCFLPGPSLFFTVTQCNAVVQGRLADACTHSRRYSAAALGSGFGKCSGHKEFLCVPWELSRRNVLSLTL